ncbi:class I SAM-dependent methyltransferase [Halarchaeum nitratireducens]|uniref:SAM-dependent methyltransferase n=1 Tax=Halarchaeum nitratireducens TaxID=489913 RepID=A0A830G9I9_9EURY|nr:MULTISPECIES: class I SAM-dependent methyltransferase [Halarchaeum]MBP2249769.1 ubiquinone/menaquinone biosynthesis C-methylase UbiE [Halarchaeum solikamskense]GGN10689.1 SAM-dependent methyltransferase [Halarchaeum nitratireducens]
MTDHTDQKRETAASFGSATDAYLASDVHGEGRDLETLADWCADATTALDVATGAGHAAGAVADRGVPDVVGLDASPEMVRTATDAFDGVAGVVGDAERLPVADDSVDAVTCRIAAHHFPDPEAFLAEAARVLTADGRLVIEDNVAPADADLAAFLNRVERLRDPSHVESYTVERWREWLRAAGFEVERTARFKKTLDFDAWAAAQSLDGATRERVETVLREADADARALFEIETSDGTVESFANLKAIFDATPRE